jgi:hypothetical protein
LVLASFNSRDSNRDATDDRFDDDLTRS